MTTIRTSDGVNVLPTDIIYYPRYNGLERLWVVGEMSAGYCAKKQMRSFFSNYEKCLNWVLDLNEGPEHEDFDEED